MTDSSLKVNFGDGKIPAIVQDVATKTVLTAGLINEEALIETILSRQIWFCRNGGVEPWLPEKVLLCKAIITRHRDAFLFLVEITPDFIEEMSVYQGAVSDDRDRRDDQIVGSSTLTETEVIPMKQAKPDFGKRGGTLPAVIADYKTKDVLILGYLNEEAWGLTLESGEVWLYSTSHRKLWHKGSTSGNLLKFKEAVLDCDCDALLILVEVLGDGVACHTNTRSCFERIREGISYCYGENQPVPAERIACNHLDYDFPS